MSRRRLTAAGISKIKRPTKAKGQVDHFAEGYPGLALRVSYGGGKSWVYFYRHQGKQKRLTLGQWPALGLADAHEAWREARKRLAEGKEPIMAPAVVAANDFASVVAEWLKRDQADNRTYDEVKRILDKEVLPVWGQRRIGEIGRHEVMELIDGIVDRGAVTQARRCHARLHRLFRWAAQRGTIGASPMVDLPKPGAEVRRERVLSDDELRLAWNAAEQVGWPIGSAIQLLMLTAARRDEIGALQWSEVDRTRNELHLAGARTKNGEPHTIPLSTAARSLIDALPRVAGSTLVFTTTGTTPISGWSRAKRNVDQLMPEAAPWRVHDLRRTVATGMERLGIRLQVVEALLGHVAGSRAGVVGIYQRHTYDDEKREALQKWAEHLASLTGAKVTPDKRARREHVGEALGG